MSKFLTSFILLLVVIHMVLAQVGVNVNRRRVGVDVNRLVGVNVNRRRGVGVNTPFSNVNWDDIGRRLGVNVLGGLVNVGYDRNDPRNRVRVNVGGNPIYYGPGR